jgi:hypothetical protein
MDIKYQSHSPLYHTYQTQQNLDRLERYEVRTAKAAQAGNQDAIERLEMQRNIREHYAPPVKVWPWMGVG